MTVVNPKSISGINSITMASGSDNLLTIHTTNTTERVRINSSGDVIVGSGITASPDGNIFATGVTTSTTFVGNLTGNVTGNATGLSGTPNISAGTIAGSTGTFSDDVTLTGTNKKIISNSSSSGDYIRLYAAGGTGKWDIYGNSANLRFSDNDSSGNIQMDRPLVMNSQNIVMSSGNGIDFSATGDGSGTDSSELLDDYEEGTWTPTVNNGFNSVSYSIQRGWYVKIGNLLHASFFLRFSGSGASTHMRFAGIPYASADLSPAYSSGGNVIYTNIPGIDSSANAGTQAIFLGDNYTYFELYSNGNSSSATGSGGFSDKDIYGHLTYRTG